ncbi:MAG: serine/threonine protein kinase [Candidatus Obscuribacterales bacterium]|nr:serine/threonine protein kinase [Candidatus Obscuribacterales bacterium]
MTTFTSVPCPLCPTPDNTVVESATPRCQHRIPQQIDARKELDDWLDDCRLFGSRVCLVCRRYFPADTHTCSYDGTVLREGSVRERTAPLIERRLQLTSYLGAGSITEVYGGTDLQNGSGIAFKVLRRALAHDAKVSSAFLEEAVRGRSLTHPHIAGVFHCGVLPNGRPYAVTEYLPNYRSLMTIVKESAEPDYMRLLKIMNAACTAILYAHGKGILHLHPSTSNIAVCGSQNDGGELAKVCDFGVVEKLFRHLPVDQHASRTTGIFGTPLVISPEYSRGEPATEKSDVYGLASSLYSAIARRPAFQKDSALGTVLAHLQEEAPPFEAHLNVPSRLSELIFAALAKDPTQRPSLTHFRAALQVILNDL